MENTVFSLSESNLHACKLIKPYATAFQYVRLNVEVVRCKGPRNTDKIYSSSSSSCTKEMMKANNKVSSSKMDELRFLFR